MAEFNYVQFVAAIISHMPEREKIRNLNALARRLPEKIQEINNYLADEKLLRERVKRDQFTMLYKSGGQVNDSQVRKVTEPESQHLLLAKAIYPYSEEKRARVMKKMPPPVRKEVEGILAEKEFSYEECVEASSKLQRGAPGNKTINIA